MILIKNIGDSFDDLGYPDLKQLENYLVDLNLVNFSKLISWLTNNLNQTSSIESTVNEIKSNEDANLFRIELSGLLKELGSPYNVDQLDDLNSKLTILNYLCGEVLAASIQFVKKSDESEFDESEIAKQLRLILMSLGVSKPPPNVTCKQLFDKITESVDNEFKKRNIEIEESILFKNFKNTQIGPKMWSRLDECNELLKQEYEMRKRTLITRSDCTVASFKWSKSDDKKELEKKINDFYAKFNYLLERDIYVDVTDVMALKPSDFNQLNNVISKTHETCSILPPENNKLANQGLQQKLSLYKFLIKDKIKDRGGRTETLIKPQQETFSQQQQQREQQQQRQNRQQNFNQNRNFDQSQRQNFNLNSNRVQGSGWNQNQNYQRQSSDNYQGNQNRQYSKNQRYDNQQDQYNGGGGQQQQQQRGRNDGYHRGGGRGGRGGGNFRRY